MRINFFLAGLLLLLFLGTLLPSASANGGTLSGRVEIKTKNNQPVENYTGVVVYLKEVNGNKGFSPAKDNPSMASENMEFNPWVVPVLAGTSVVFPNKDDAIHNAFSVSKPKKFDLGRYGYGEQNIVLFDKPGAVYVFCKIHPKMNGCVLVLGNPYFTLVDKNGNYSLRDVPPGQYTIVGW